jgi:hypothetical protein
VNAMARHLVPALLYTALALFLPEIRMGRGMRDFAVYRQAATRALYAEPLDRPEDGHYQATSVISVCTILLAIALTHLEWTKLA